MVGLLNKFNFSSSNSFSLLEIYALSSGVYLASFSVGDNALYSLIVSIKGVFICLSSSVKEYPEKVEARYLLNSLSAFSFLSV